MTSTYRSIGNVPLGRNGSKPAVYRLPGGDYFHIGQADKVRDPTQYGALQADNLEIGGGLNRRACGALCRILLIFRECSCNLMQ